MPAACPGSRGRSVRFGARRTPHCCPLSRADPLSPPLCLALPRPRLPLWLRDPRGTRRSLRAPGGGQEFWWKAEGLACGDRLRALGLSPRERGRPRGEPLAPAPPEEGEQGQEPARTGGEGHKAARGEAQAGHQAKFLCWRVERASQRGSRHPTCVTVFQGHSDNAPSKAR